MKINFAIFKRDINLKTRNVRRSREDEKLREEEGIFDLLLL